MNLKPATLLSVFFILATGLLLNSCKKDKPPVINFDYGYFPNTVGKYVIYDVDSIYCSSFDYKIDTVRYQLMEVMQSLFPDNLGRPTQRIERYVKMYSDSIPYSSMPWTLRNVWMANLTATDAERVENNVRYVKLIFPVVQNNSWNGNAFNTLGSCSYSYTSIDQRTTIADPPYTSSIFDSVLTVTQINSQTLISDTFCLEQYAKNVGLVYKLQVAVINDTLNAGNDTQPILQRRYTTGVLKYSLTINSHNLP